MYVLFVCAWGAYLVLINNIYITVTACVRDPQTAFNNKLDMPGFNCCDMMSQLFRLKSDIELLNH